MKSPFQQYQWLLQGLIASLNPGFLIYKMGRGIMPSLQYYPIRRLSQMAELECQILKEQPAISLIGYRHYPQQSEASQLHFSPLNTVQSFASHWLSKKMGITFWQSASRLIVDRADGYKVLFFVVLFVLDIEQILFQYLLWERLTTQQTEIQDAYLKHIY